MAWYRPPPVGADLKYGLERRIERDDSVDEHLDGLVDSLRRVIEDGGGAERKGGVVTWRGMLTRYVCWEAGKMGDADAPGKDHGGAL